MKFSTRPVRQVKTPLGQALHERNLWRRIQSGRALLCPRCSVLLVAEDYKNQIAKFEAELAQLKRDHGINVIKWQDVPKPSLKLKGYKACIEYLRYWIPCDAVRIGPTPRQMQRSEEPVNERQVNCEIFVHDLGAVVPVVKPRRPDLTTQSARNAVRGSTPVARLAGR